MTNDPSRFCVLKSAYVDGRLFKISAVRVSGDDVFLRLSGIDDRNAAELLRGKYIEIDRAAAVALEDGEFFIDDLVGSMLVARSADGSKRIGVIQSVQSFGAADVITVQTLRGEMTFAFVKALNAEFNEDANELYVDAERLNEVAVYDED